jgi:hypothetical protein
MNIKLIKKIGIGATVVGAVLGLVANWANEKQQEALIDEKVTEKLLQLTAQTSEATAVENN